MRTALIIISTFLLIISVFSCKQQEKTSNLNIIFLHHSTGFDIWKGDTEQKKFYTLMTRISYKFGTGKLPSFFERYDLIPTLMRKYNKENKEEYRIEELTFPKPDPYGWNNYPYDYYNIWVKNAGEDLFMEEPTLEILTKKYQLIIFKHCFPVSNIQEDNELPDANSDLKTIPNYKLQYLALRDKLHKYPDTKFILFTGAAQLKHYVSEDEAKRAREFFKWVINEWDMTGDNIYLWDLYNLQTEGEFYFKDDYAISNTDAHLNKVFADKAGRLLFNRIIDVIENNGHKTDLTGVLK